MEPFISKTLLRNDAFSVIVVESQLSFLFFLRCFFSYEKEKKVVPMICLILEKVFFFFIFLFILGGIQMKPLTQIGNSCIEKPVGART